MSRRLVIGLAAACGLAALTLALVPRRAGPAGGREASVEQGDFEVWSSYPGKLEARRVEVILSRFSGSATIVELAPEGMPVHAGDLLVRFDSSQVERELLRLERDAALARSELERIENAEQPLELRDLEAKLVEADGLYESEKSFLEDTRELVAEELVSPQEVEQQKLKVDQARANAEKLRIQLDLTRSHLHPSALTRARATLASAEQELAIARAQFSNCTVYAPSDGVVVYRPVHTGGEFRPARVGDTIFKNQPFMIIPDMRDLIVECLVPEAELSRVEAGRPVVITPLSFPDLRLKGTVESVGSMATTAMDRPAWQRFFRVVIGLNEADPRLRSGMSVQADILSYRKTGALVIPRAAVRLDGGAASCRQPGAGEETPIRVGWANMTHFELLSGLDAGDRVLLP